MSRKVREIEGYEANSIACTLPENSAAARVFVEADGELLGTLPAARVPDLLKDLRGQTAGPLAPETPETDLPEPIHSVVPVRIAEVLAEGEGVPPSADVAPPAEDPGLQKLSPDLREKLAGEGGGAARSRLEVILNTTPRADDRGWRESLIALPGVAVEGRIGPVVTNLVLSVIVPVI